MPVRFERDKDFLKIILEGTIRLEDLYAGVDEIYAQEAVPSKVLWDMHNGYPDEDDDTSASLREFSKYATTKGKDRANGKVALIAPSALKFGLSRMSTTFAEQNNAAYNMKPFRDESEAMAWLRGEIDD